MSEPSAVPHQEPARAPAQPALSGTSARLRAVGVWALATTATLAVPGAVVATLSQEADGLALLVGFALLIALFLVAPVAGLAWAVHVALCAFVASHRHRRGARTSVLLDAAIGAGVALPIWLLFGGLVANALDVPMPTTDDRTTALVAAGALSWLVVLGAFNGWRLGVIARRRATSA
jgi:hypothetical protein